MDHEIEVYRKRGRPFGHRLSEKTKDKIRNKRFGTHHSQATKDKISRSLSEYFLRRDSLADSLEHEYSYISEEATEWIHSHKAAIDDSEYVITEKKLSYLKQMELCLGNDIEYLFGHNLTPELLLMLKEDIIELYGKDVAKEMCSLL